MARDRKGAQLSFELPPGLLERLRAHAAAERRTVAAVLRGWIEAGLAGALERDVAQLQLGAIKATKRRERPDPLPAVKVSEMSDSGGFPPDLQEPPASPDRVIPAPPVGDAITTAQLAERTGTNRSAWNNWARDKQPGAVRKMPPEVGQWRLVGKAAAEAGGPARWLWELAC